MNKISSFKKIVSIGFFAAFLAVFLSVGTAQAGFWDWLNIGGDSQQAAISGSKTYTLRVNKSGLGGKYISVTSADGKINCGSDCSERYVSAQNVTLTAISKNNNYSFDKWTGGGCSGSGSCVVEVNKPNGTVSVRAIFKKGPSASRDASETVPSNSSSSSTSANHTATTGTVTNKTSTSATLNGKVNPKGENVYYNFIYYKYGGSAATSSTSWLSAGSGSSDVSISANISGLSSGATYSYYVNSYSYTTKKYVNGSAGGINSFTLSGGSSSSSSNSSSSISSSSSVQQYTLKVKISGAGKIMSDPTGIDCKKDSKGKSSGVCSIKVNKDESVTLDASPNLSYEFGIWGDACKGKGSSQTCVVKIGSNKTVSATFNKKGSANKETASVSVRKTGKGVGKVVSINSSGKEISGINCGSNCSENYEKICENTEGGRGCSLAYFRAVAEKGSTFSGWGGGCLTFKNVKDQCYVHLDGNKTINANFNKGSNNTTGKYYDLTVTVSEGGTVASTDGKINCSSGNSPCAKSYGKNGTVTLKITPNSGYYIENSSVVTACSSYTSKNDIRTCKVKMTKNQNLTVNFKASGTSSSSSSSKASSSSAGSYSTVTGSASNITSTSATLNGTIIPNGNSLSYTFAYRKNSESSSATKYAPSNIYTSIGSASGDVSVSADISGLSSGTKYIYRLYVWNSKTEKLTEGLVKYFTTSSDSSSSSSSSSNITLKITLSGTGSVFRDGHGNLGCGTDQAPAANNVCTQTIKNDGLEHELTGASGSLKSWSGCDSTENIINKGLVCKFKADGNKNITATFN